MTTPVEVVSPSTSIDEAGRRMAGLGVHQLIVTEESRAVGVVSALDVVSALLGMPVVRPAAFAHFDPSTGAIWTDEVELKIDALAVAPDGPGVFVLLESAPLERKRVVWIEAVRNVRSRLVHLLSSRQHDDLLARHLEHPDTLRFRATAVADESERSRVVSRLKESALRWPGSAFRCETAHTPTKSLPHAAE